MHPHVPSIPDMPVFDSCRSTLSRRPGLALAVLLVGAGLVVSAAPASAQSAPKSSAPALQKTSPAAPAGSSSVSPSAVTTPAPQTSAPNVLDQPPSPATIVEQSGQLSVRADNSSLAQILRQLSSKTGMQLEGLSGDERVFGTFGPGSPRDVLTSLLNGTAYNIVMIGDLANGAPRQLVLTPRGSSSGAPPAQTIPSPAPAASPDDQNGGDDADQPPPDDDGHPGEVIIEQAPENEQPQPEAPQAGPRTPEQMLQQMQQMRNAQQNQEVQPNQDGQPNQGTQDTEAPQ